MPCRFNAVAVQSLTGILDQNPSHTLSPSGYWHRLRPALRDVGISRLADITGLDHVGFPVVQAVRPDARSNAVTQGKADSKEGAAIGAMLECLEMAAGEDLDHLPAVPQQNCELWSSFAPGLPTGMVWPDEQTKFIECWDTVADGPSALPVDLISTDFSQDAAATAAPILRHSIGLGAGTNFAAAFMHGLLECIEADARTRVEAQGGAQRIALSVDDPVYGALLAQLEKAGMRVIIENLPCKGGVVTASASIMEKPGATALPLPAMGYAARRTFSEAIAAALAEATQARLAVISGAREDITQRFYTHGASPADLEAEWRRHGTTPFAAEPPTIAPATLRQIASAVGPVYAVPLHWDANLPLAILRVVAPDLIADPMRLELK
jgi:ribosomal protein S12 methylthiotransferase accessory factor